MSEAPAQPKNINALVGKSLDGFCIQDFTEVYRTNEDGRKVTSIGFFRDRNLAKAFAQNQTDADYHKVGSALLLTNGQVGFPVGAQSVKIFDSNEAELQVRQKALAKLTPEEKQLLGL